MGRFEMNPFTPTFGDYPPVRAGRTELLRHWELAFNPDLVTHPYRTAVLLADAARPAPTGNRSLNDTKVVLVDLPI